MTVLGDFSSKNYLRQISILATNKSKIQTIKAPQLHQLLKLTLQTYLYFFWFLPWWYLKLRFVSNNFRKKNSKNGHCVLRLRCGLKLEDDEAVLRERNWGGVNNNEVVVNGQSQDAELISRLGQHQSKERLHLFSSQHWPFTHSSEKMWYKFVPCNWVSRMKNF